MSDFVPRDILPDLWDEILRRHWTYLETEASLQKLEECKKLEGCLKEFLCVVPHDRKFFLPETAHVLRKSIREMDDFTANKAIIGFESISQYANNLFTKPWRKEFRVLKMYSGFFQHEVKTNLLDAEKLFEAMGYRRLSDEILVLDGPICPDQVTNVSRDAMAAYVECKIIKHIYSGLLAMGLTCTWKDVYHYREKHIGGTTQAIKGLTFAIQERLMRREKFINTDSCYATIQHSPQAPKTMVPQCQNCTPYHLTQPHHMQSQQLSNSQCALHSQNNSCGLHVTQTQTNPMYNGVGGINGKLLSSYPAGTGYQQQQHFPASTVGMQPHMSHSRSLEHYNEPPALLPHRHSFDHQQQGCTAHHYPQNLYETPYDCLDGGGSLGSSVSYAAVSANGANCNLNAAYTHPYNVSGNRYPLPYNISNQLNGGIKGDLYGNAAENEYATVTKPHNCNYHPQQSLPSTRQIASAPALSKDFQTLRQQRSFPPDPLIDFDDRAPLTLHDYHAQFHSLSQNNSFDNECEHMYDQPRHERRSVNRANPIYAQSKEICQHMPPAASALMPQLPTSDNMYGNYIYAHPVPRGSRTGKGSLGPTNMTDKYLRNSDLIQDCVDNNHKMQMELKHYPINGDVCVDAGNSNRRKLSTHNNERDASDLSCESTLDEFVNVGHSEHPQMQRSPTQASKNQDGVGSFESWNYVFKNLERSGYSKDLGERGDLLVQSLDLGSLNLANGTGKTSEKRRSNQQPMESLTKAGRPLMNSEKSRILEKPNIQTSGDHFVETGIVHRAASGKKDKNTISQLEKDRPPTGSGISTVPMKKKSLLKNTVANSNNGAANDNINGNEFTGERNTGTTYVKATASAPTAGNVRSSKRQMSTGASAGTTVRSNSNKLGPVSTQVIVSSPNEWSCRFCTFLNPDTKRICEMCCRSKDFNLEASVSHTPTCV